ncbi:MAG: GNAT family N-acetyltransferase [Chitinophagaceae bacterium]|nr:GNAT family N-acetyltransferase [Chitinophagaceae bacterium]
MQSLNFTPFPALTTERLSLRPLTTDDANEIYIHRSDERILEFLDMPKATSVEDALAFIQRITNHVANNESIFWGIQLINDPYLIGSICLWNIEVAEDKAEVGYVLHPDYQGKGLMQEALAAVIDFGFNHLHLKIIVADLHSGNKKSLQLLQRNGFVFESKSEEMVIYSLKNNNVKVGAD